MKTIKKAMAAAVAVAVVLIGCLVTSTATTARAQERMRYIPIPFGTITNILTNVVVNASGTNYTYVTNAAANFSPGLFTNGPALPGVSQLNFGGNYTMPPTWAGGQQNAAMPASIINGWFPVPQNQDLCFDMIGYQSNTAVAGVIGLGFDYSDDAFYGTTNMPFWVLYTVAPAGTNLYRCLINRTNFQNAAYMRLDCITNLETIYWVDLTNRIVGFY